MSQHEQVGETKRWVNEHGATIEQTFWQPSELDDKGRCCDRKPIYYKRALAGGEGRFCHKCDREYTASGKQRQNWAFKLDPAGCYERQKTLQGGSIT